MTSRTLCVPLRLWSMFAWFFFPKDDTNRSMSITSSFLSSCGASREVADVGIRHRFQSSAGQVDGDLLEFHQWMRGRGLRPNTVRVYAGTLRSLSTFVDNPLRAATAEDLLHGQVRFVDGRSLETARAYLARISMSSSWAQRGE